MLASQQHRSSAAACLQPCASGRACTSMPSLGGGVCQLHQEGCSMLPPLYAAVPLASLARFTAIVMNWLGPGCIPHYCLSCSRVCPLPHCCPPCTLQFHWDGPVRAWLHGETHFTDWSAQGQMMQGRRAFQSRKACSRQTWPYNTLLCTWRWGHSQPSTPGRQCSVISSHKRLLRDK